MRIASASRSRVRPVTSNGSTVTVTCALCVGAVRELYLPATLKSIADAVDLVVVNDDSGLARSESDADSKHPFRRFRRRAQQSVRAAAAPDWVMFPEADEVLRFAGSPTSLAVWRFTVLLPKSHGPIRRTKRARACAVAQWSYRTSIYCHYGDVVQPRVRAPFTGGIRKGPGRCS